MAASPRRVLDGVALRQVRRLFDSHAQPLTLERLAALDKDRESPRYSMELARRTHQDMRIRIAHRLNDFLFLPYKVLTNQSVYYVYEKYVEAFLLHNDIGEIHSDKMAEEYWRTLAHIFDSNTKVTKYLGRGRNELARLDPELVPRLDSFLDRFFNNRIGTHLTGAAFLHYGRAPSGTKKPAGVALGVVQDTDVVACVRRLQESIADLCQEESIPIELEVEGVIADAKDASKVSIAYIPMHIHVILREILQNAVRATIRSAKHSSKSPHPVRVGVNRGRFGVFVTVSDRGAGIKDLDRVWSWGPNDNLGAEPLTDDELNQCTEIEEDSDTKNPPLPLGFGVPLTRLVARYFGGDVQLRTLLGHGTNAYIHIPELQREGLLSSVDIPFG